MIVAIGVDVDDTFVRFVQTALEAEIEPRCINLRVAVEGEWRFELPARTPARLRYAGEEIALSPEEFLLLSADRPFRRVGAVCRKALAGSDGGVARISRHRARSGRQPPIERPSQQLKAVARSDLAQPWLSRA